MFDVPWDNLVAAKDGLYLQTAHDLPLIAGHVTRSTPVSPAKLTLLQTLDPALLHEAGADAVIVHREQDGDGSLERLARQQLGDPVYEDGSLALFMTPKTDAAAGFMALPSELTTITTQADSYVYAPQDGWVSFSADLHTEDNRTVNLLLDGVIAQRLTVDGEQAIRVPLPVMREPLPDDFAGARSGLSRCITRRRLECRSVGLADVKIGYTSVKASPAVTFEKGVTMARSFVPPSAHAGESLAVWLWWQFDQAIDASDVRFVHVTDSSGKLIAQQDNPLGAIAAGETRAEAVEIALPADLPAGEYTVSVGWYSYPAIENFCVLTNGSCGERSLTVGTVKVG